MLLKGTLNYPFLYSWVCLCEVFMCALLFVWACACAILPLNKKGADSKCTNTTDNFINGSTLAVRAALTVSLAHGCLCSLIKWPLLSLLLHFDITAFDADVWWCVYVLLASHSVSGLISYVEVLAPPCWWKSTAFQMVLKRECFLCYSVSKTTHKWHCLQQNLIYRKNGSGLIWSTNSKYTKQLIMQIQYLYTDKWLKTTKDSYVIATVALKYTFCH